jgi:hypothetical protein
MDDAPGPVRIPVPCERADTEDADDKLRPSAIGERVNADRVSPAGGAAWRTNRNVNRPKPKTNGIPI